jgi:predicted small lipoprotein YifL
MKNFITWTTGVLLLSLVGCGTWAPNHYPANLSNTDAQKQYYQCEREAQHTIPQTFIPDNDRWIHVARMRNACLFAQGWHN